MKRFIIISLLAIGASQLAHACLWFDSHNSYLFKVCNEEEFSSRVDKITINNWKAYLGNTTDYWWFDADQIINFAEQKGDALMVSYVRHLVQYLECVQSVRSEQWEYPTKADIDKRNNTLRSIRTYAQGKIKSKLRSQHALLFMRCNMMLGYHQENVTFWEETASQFIESVYKDMMQNIYAGALYKTGHLDRAGELFAEMHDWNSLMTQYYKKRSFAAIRQEYRRNPNSAVLPFLLQDFVNNAQEAIDGEGVSQGKLFVRTITRNEAEMMWHFAGQVVSEGKTHQPALWKSAQAWLEYLFGNGEQALQDINAAMTLDGSERVKDVARVLKLYITSAQSPLNAQFERYLADEIKWMTDKPQEDGFFVAALDRTVHQVLADKYMKAGRENTSMALYQMVHSYNFTNALDTMSTTQLQNYLAYLKGNSDSSPVDRFVKPRLDYNEKEYFDRIGAKYMCVCQWDKALEWLNKVPLSYYNQKGYVNYAYYRRYTVEPWITRQWLTEAQQGENGLTLSANPRMAFAREMQKMEGELNVLSGKAREQRLYDLAVRYAQASISGDCWFLTHDGKSAYAEVSPNETDMDAKAVSLLRQAVGTKDPQLKERVLFALSYVYLNKDRWFETKWNNETGDYSYIPQRDADQYKAFARLADFEESKGGAPSDYVSRCDEYTQFIHSYYTK